MPRIMFVELNEVNFELVEGYIARGELPRWRRFFELHGYARTTSEVEHERANPWIQWPTAHTGLDLDEHGVFRMGDMYYHDHEQIWERLESAGLEVGALTPFNATNRTKHAAFFMPDPWMRTPFMGPRPLRYVYEALLQVADDYATARIAPATIAKLAAGGLAYMRWKGVPAYVGDTLRYLQGNRWRRALVADRLLADAFLTLWRRTRPDFASVCFNGGAHLQHHYLHASPVTTPPFRNPEWWLGAGQDPVLASYRLYDELLGDLERADPGARIMLATALHQDPHERVAHYYRLNEHERVFRALGIPFDNIVPLMTEDFVVEYADEAQARRGQQMIEAVHASRSDYFYLDTGDVPVRRLDTGPQAFYVDNRGRTLYVQLKPAPREMPDDLALSRDGHTVEHFLRLVAHAQLRNGHHTGVGYFADSAVSPGELKAEFPLRDLFPMILTAFGLDPTVRRPAGRPAEPGRRERATSA
jgi:hypothetical protein